MLVGRCDCRYCSLDRSGKVFHLVDGVTSDSACDGGLMNNGLRLPRSMSCAPRAATVTPGTNGSCPTSSTIVGLDSKKCCCFRGCDRQQHRGFDDHLFPATPVQSPSKTTAFPSSCTLAVSCNSGAERTSTTMGCHRLCLGSMTDCVVQPQEHSWKGVGGLRR